MEDGRITIHLQFERHTDVMHVDIVEPTPSARINAVEVGNLLGFDGRVIARVGDDGQLYGLTVLQFTSVKRTLRLRYRVFAWKRALQLFIAAILAGRKIVEATRHCSAPA